MNIVPTTRTVVDYACTFSSDEVQLARDDPYSFGEKFREQLLALDPKPEANGNGKHPNRVHITLGRRSAKGAGKKRAAKKAAPKSQKTLLQCPQCDRTFKQAARLNNHLRDAHGETASASTNTWQKEPAPAAES